MHVIINTAALSGHEVSISNEAAEVVRLSVNPSSRSSVDEIKALSAALVTVCRRLRAADTSIAREMSLAITDVETACMWAVKGATKGA